MKAWILAVATATGAAALGGMAPTAAAEYQTPAAGACKSALPVFDGNIRSRPRGVQNEGSTNAFVSCAQQSDFDDSPTEVSLFLLNVGASAASVSCTLVVGATVPLFFTETIEVPANSYGTWLVFDSPAANAWDSRAIAYSCELPPGAGISRVVLTVQDPV
ncbi:hypothetical protein H5368_05725 [Luteimonas sp. MC1782]|uniref:hypothetical protein n=1 Tax=Luteimonas sp. MC1782 TaxID=2760305 RepID=UPI0016025E03|nr:hypothetical protein [Luteimonas sp. MC1782]MBB1472522.1 hypothetical protein [Luteimonas sp. MC1782]